MPVAVVTDSTACLPPGTEHEFPLTVIPMRVTVNGYSGAEGTEVTAEDIARAFQARRVEVATSRPSPGSVAAIYQELLDGGAGGVVSVHLSAALSGTYESAVLAAREFGDKVTVIDSANAGMGLGFSVLAAAAAAKRGRGAGFVADTARAAVRATETFFYVDTLEFLRRGGRISAAGALLGTALAVKPILHVEAGEVKLRDKVRTSARALARLEDLVVAAGNGDPVDLALHHLRSPERAEELAHRLRDRFGRQVRDVVITEVGAVIAAHCGPGLLGAVVHRRGKKLSTAPKLSTGPGRAGSRRPAALVGPGMTVFTQAPAMRGIHTTSAKSSKRTEFAAAVRSRLGRLTGTDGDSVPDSCLEVVDPRSGTVVPERPVRPRGRFGLTGARYLLAGRSRAVLAVLLLVVAVTAGALAWFSWPAPQPATGALAVAQTQDGGDTSVGRVKVSVVGDVAEPGIVEVSSGSRVADAIEAAGGLTPESASPGYLNLARKVKDGELIVVEAAPEPGEEPEAPADSDAEPPATAGDPPAAGEPVNINQATAEELATLPGIGPVTAAAIVEYRDSNGGFDSVEQLAEVDGIGPATLDKLAGKVAV